MKLTGLSTKSFRIAGLGLAFAVLTGSVWAQEQSGAVTDASGTNHTRPVNMTFSGTSGTSATNLQQPNTLSGEDDYAGTGTLGSFTFRLLEADPNSPTSSNTCAGANEIYFVLSAGGGAFRFQDGSLLYVQLTQGSDCIDLAAGKAHCIRNLQITGGTGRFNNVSPGTLLTLTETVVPVLADALGNPVFFAATGKITGTVAGASDWQGQGGGQ